MITYKEQTFEKIDEFDFVTLKFSGGDGGKISEKLPISTYKDRVKQTLQNKKRFPDKVLINHFKDFIEVKIIDDNAQTHTVKFSNDHEKEITKAIRLVNKNYGIKPWEN